MSGNPNASRPKTVSFFQDDGYRLSGDLYCAVREPQCGIVFCQGYGGTKEYVAPEIARGLVERCECAVLTFDYSGFGKSEGPRRRLDPMRQVRDTRAALSWMSTELPHVEGRFGVYGTSFGGAIATSVGANDGRVRALVAVSSPANGEQWMRDLRPHWQYVEFRERLAADARNRVMAGSSETVNPDWIMPRDPEAAAFNEGLIAKFPSRHFELDIASAQLIVEFEPSRDVGRLRGRPCMFIHCERDLLIPWRHSAELARRSGGQFILLPGLGHYEIYEGEPFARVLDLAVGWYRQHLWPKEAGA